MPKVLNFSVPWNYENVLSTENNVLVPFLVTLINNIIWTLHFPTMVKPRTLIRSTCKWSSMLVHMNTHTHKLNISTYACVYLHRDGFKGCEVISSSNSEEFMRYYINFAWTYLHIYIYIINYLCFVPSNFLTCPFMKFHTNVLDQSLSPYIWTLHVGWKLFNSPNETCGHTYIWTICNGIWN